DRRLGGQPRREALRNAPDRRAVSAQAIADHVVADPRLHRRNFAQSVAGTLGAIGVELTVHEQRDFLRRQFRWPGGFVRIRQSQEFTHYHLRSLSVPSSGRSSAAIASRARKSRERTVPIGQFIKLAISS